MKKLILHTICILCLLFTGLVPGKTAGAVEHEDAAEYILKLINDARKAPENTLAHIGVTKAQAQANLGTDAWVLDQGLLPVAMNETLHYTALMHANDMVSNLYYSYDSQNGDTVENRIKKAGYGLISAGESLGLLSFNKYVEPVEAAEVIFENMLAYELGNALGQDERNILNENRTEVGVAFVSTVADLGLGIPVNLYLVVADFARPVASRYFIVGNISVKTSDYPEFKLGNALAGIKMRLRELSTQTSVDIYSSATGFFQFDMPFGFSLLEAWDEKSGSLLVRRSLFGQNQNVLLDIFVDK